MLRQDGIDALRVGNHRGHEDRIHPDSEFQQAVEKQRLAESVNDPSKRDAPQRKPRKERRQDRADREDSGTEHEREHADPQQLIDQSGKTGHEEEPEQDRLEMPYHAAISDSYGAELNGRRATPTVASGSHNDPIDMRVVRIAECTA